MDKRIFTSTDLCVTPLSYGAMELRILTDLSEAEAILNTVLDEGINFIDTSPDYGPSEELIGKYVSHRRSEYYLATKCGCNPGGDHIFTPEHIRGNLEESLRRLKTDYVDLWQLHCVVPKDLPGEAEDEVIETMHQMQKEGKVRYIGVSFKNGKQTDPFYPTDNQEAFALQMSRWNVFNSIQMVYGLLTRISEPKMIAMKENGTGIIARGILKEYYPEYAVVRQKLGLTAETMLRFGLAQPFIDTMIIGSRNPQHIRDNVRAAEKGPLTPEETADLLKALEGEKLR